MGTLSADVENVYRLNKHHVTLHLLTTRGFRRGSNVGQMAPNETNKFGTFSDQISVHFVGEIRDFFRSDFSTFWRPAPKCTEI